MNKMDFVSGAVLTAFGFLLLFVIIPWQIADPSRALISPRLMPQLCAIAIIVLASAQCLKALRERDEAGMRFRREELIALVWVVALFVGALLLFRVAGPLLPAILVLVLPMLALGERRVLVLLLLPAGCISLVYVLLYVFAGTSIS